MFCILKTSLLLPVPFFCAILASQVKAIWNLLVSVTLSHQSTAVKTAVPMCWGVSVVFWMLCLFCFVFFMYSWLSVYYFVFSLLVCISGLVYEVVFKVLIYDTTCNCTICHLNAEIQCKTCRSAYGSIMNSKWIYFDPWWMFQWITNEFTVIGHKKC